MVAGDLITFKNPKYPYQSHAFMVLYGWTDQNGINYQVCSLGYMTRGSRTSMVILDREATYLGKLTGDSFYALKDAYYSSDCMWDKPELAIYGAEPIGSKY